MLELERVINWRTSMRMATSSFARCGVIFTETRWTDCTEEGILRYGANSTCI
jgi:hypothetical protein